MARTGDEPKTEQLRVSEVLPDALSSVWAQVGKTIVRALGHASGDSTTPEQFYASCQRGEMKTWAVHRGDEVVAVVIFRVTDRDAMRVLFIEVVAGRDMAAWVDQVERLLRDYRDLVGADAIQTLSRDGMVRRLLRRGWKKKATLMELRDG